MEANNRNSPRNFRGRKAQYFCREISEIDRNEQKLKISEGIEALPRSKDTSRIIGTGMERWKVEQSTCYRDGRIERRKKGGFR
jgi:hypothetical protein